MKLQLSVIVFRFLQKIKPGSTYLNCNLKPAYSLFILLIGMLFLACNGDTSNVDNENFEASGTMPSGQTESASNANAADSPHLVKVKEIIAFQTGSNLLKNVSLDGKVATIEYSNDFITSSEGSISVDEYWTSGKRLEKLMTDLPLQLMMHTGYVEQVKISIPHKGQIHYADVSKEKLEAFVGKSFKDIVNDMEDSFLTPYVRIHSGRTKYINTFVVVK